MKLHASDFLPTARAAIDNYRLVRAAAGAQMAADRLTTFVDGIDSTLAGILQSAYDQGYRQAVAMLQDAHDEIAASDAYAAEILQQALALLKAEAPQ